MCALTESELLRYTRQQLIGAILELQVCFSSFYPLSVLSQSAHTLIQRAVGEFDSRVEKVRSESDQLRRDSSVLAAYVAELQQKIRAASSSSSQQQQP